MALSMPTLYDRKEYVVDTEPSEASVTFLNKFVVKKHAKKDGTENGVCSEYSGTLFRG